VHVTAGQQVEKGAVLLVIDEGGENGEGTDG
jgi:multidrug efflux pump subunit AcrA (membrane-fusion protein)